MIQKDGDKTLMYTEETPNPLALKFILGKPIVHEGHYLFSSLQEAQGLPVLEDVLSLPGIESLLLTREFLTVTKTGDVPWSLLESIILSALEYFKDKSKEEIEGYLLAHPNEKKGIEAASAELEPPVKSSDRKSSEQKPVEK